MSLNKSKWYKGEDIRGEYQITVDPSDPLSVITDLTGTTFQLIVKSSILDADADALADLSLGAGLTLTAVTVTDYVIEFVIPGTATENINPPNPRNSVVEIEYEFNATYPFSTQADVLDRGIIKIDTDRVLTNL